MDESVSQWILISCQQNPAPNVKKLIVWSLNDVIRHVTTTGSVSELYITPMLSCIGDLDQMEFDSTQLVVTSRRHIPQQLSPDDFSENVEIFEIDGSSLPGSVYLELLRVGELRQKQSGSADFEFVPTQDVEDTYLSWDMESEKSRRGDDFELRGPALKSSGNMCTAFDGSRYTGDIVVCLRCLSWPFQAAEWVTRKRNHGWPAEADVESIVKTGCDVVHVAHQQHRSDEWYRSYLWRLSFSRAETVLLNSWTLKQQIVYHLLRTVTDHTKLKEVYDESGCRILSRYHLKTLMMVYCETWSQNWWQNTNLVRLCRDIFKALTDCLARGLCSSYFVATANLFECDTNSAGATELTHRLSFLTDLAQLTDWFCVNYVKKCVERSPDHIQQLFQQLNQNAIASDELKSQFSEWLCNQTPLQSVEQYEWALQSLQQSAVEIMKYSRNKVTDSSTSLARIDPLLSLYYSALLELYLASEIEANPTFGSCDGNFFIDVLIAVTSQPGETFVTQQRNNSNRKLIEKAVNLLMKVLNNCRSSSAAATQLLLYLIHTILRAASIHIDVIDHETGSATVTHCLAQLYLAIVYFVTRQRSSAAEHCTRVIRTCTVDSQCRSQVLTTDSLPKLDKNIDNVLGLVNLYRYVSKSKQCCFVGEYQYTVGLKLSTCVCFLLMKCYQSNRSAPLLNTVAKTWRRFLTRSQSSSQQIEDFLLAYVTSVDISNTCVAYVHFDALQFGTEKLRDLLEQAAIDNITVCHEMLSNEFTHLGGINTSSYQAIHLYKQGFHVECLQLCQDTIRSSNLWRTDRWFPVVVGGILTYLVDDNIAQLGALRKICYYLRSGQECSLFSIGSLDLAVYLSIQCKKILKLPSASLKFDLYVIQQLNKIHSLDDEESRLLMAFSFYRLKAYIACSERPDTA